MICRALALVASGPSATCHIASPHALLTGVEGESGVDLGGDSAGDDLQDLLTELDEEGVHGVLGLLLEVATVRQGSKP